MTAPGARLGEGTLVEDLGAAALSCEFEAEGAASGVGAHYLRALATRLRAAAQRLREEAADILRCEQDTRDTNDTRGWADAALRAQMLGRINGGPLSPEAPTKGTL